MYHIFVTSFTVTLVPVCFVVSISTLSRVGFTVSIIKLLSAEPVLPAGSVTVTETVYSPSGRSFPEPTVNSFVHVPSVNVTALPAAPLSQVHVLSCEPALLAFISIFEIPLLSAAFPLNTSFPAVSPSELPTVLVPVPWLVMLTVGADVSTPTKNGDVCVVLYALFSSLAPSYVLSVAVNTTLYIPSADGST